MRKPRYPSRWCVALLAVTAVAAAPELAPSGRVVDESGAPIVEAKACLIVGGAEGLCDRTDRDGRYALPASEALSVRIAASGFLPLNVAAVPQESPIVLERAAALLVRVVDGATGEGIGPAEVRLVYTTGRQLGPFPANKAGLSLKTLPPGEARVVVNAKGYAEGLGEAVSLARGKKAEARVALKKLNVGSPAK